ncbi:MAG TPA: acyl-CoA dehydrogenase [Bdellovibrionota bacterium]|nr:acyl-CoA dehydrogenase [Bdellovibrionota bacterium]
MDFALSQEQEEIRKMVREFAENELRPVAAKNDRDSRFPKEQVKKLAELGLMGMVVPAEYGGSGLDTVSYAIAIEELARVCASTAVIASVNNSLVCDVIKTWGSDEQKKKYLIPLAKGEHLGAYCLTEPMSGSDAATQKTTATRESGFYVVNGAKNWITNGPQADTLILFAMFNPAKGSKGVSAFVFESKLPGVEVGKDENKLGIRASGTCTISFTNVKVPVSCRIGEEGFGFKVAMMTLDGGRIGIAAQAVGIAQAALEESIKYSKERRQFGKPIGQFQGLRWMIADMATRVEAARLLTYQAAYKKSQGGRYSKDAAIAKLFASETAAFVTNKAVQIHGGYGYISDYPVERFMRDARITEIYEGTSEIQRIVIANQLLKDVGA